MPQQRKPPFDMTAQLDSFACRDSRRAIDAGCGCLQRNDCLRACSADKGAVADGTIGIRAPALHRVVGQQRTGVLVAGGDRPGSHAVAAEVSHGDCGAADAAASTIAQLFDAVIAPAFAFATADQRAAMIATASHGDGIDDAGDGHWRGVGCGRAVAQLATKVVAPAAHGAVPERGAIVLASGSDLSDRVKVWHRPGAAL